MLIDTHSHLSFKAYDEDREEVIKRTQKEGVVCIDVGINYESSKKAVELASTNENIYASIGLHPEGAKEGFDSEKYRKLALRSPGEGRVVAIGEIGLDNKYPNPGQKDVFIKQLDLAGELNLPVIIHCRMAHEDVLEILEKRNNKGVIHCFTGNWQEAQKYLDLGFYLGINGIIFKFDIDEVIKKAPLDKLLVETDCPYLTPLPAVALAKEGPKAGPKEMRNEPIFVKYVAERIAELKGISFDEVASATTANAKKLFNI